MVQKAKQQKYGKKTKQNKTKQTKHTNPTKLQSMIDFFFFCSCVSFMNSCHNKTNYYKTNLIFHLKCYYFPPHTKNHSNKLILLNFPQRV